MIDPRISGFVWVRAEPLMTLFSPCCSLFPQSKLMSSDTENQGFQNFFWLLNHDVIGACSTNFAARFLHKITICTLHSRPNVALSITATTERHFQRVEVFRAFLVVSPHGLNLAKIAHIHRTLNLALNTSTWVCNTQWNGNASEPFRFFTVTLIAAIG